MKNKTFAMEAAPSAMPPKPNIAAMMAITKNITDQRNINFNLSERGFNQFLNMLVRCVYTVSTMNQIFVPTD